MKFTNHPHPDLSVFTDWEMMWSIIWHLLLLDVPLCFHIYFGSGSNNKISSELTIQYCCYLEEQRPGGKHISQSLKTACRAEQLVLTNKKSSAQSITISMRLRNTQMHQFLPHNPQRGSLFLTGSGNTMREIPEVSNTAYDHNQHWNACTSAHSRYFSISCKHLD